MGVLTKYNLGAGIDTIGTFKLNGELADPTIVTVRIKDPDGTETSHVYGTDLGVVKTSTGVYTYSFEASHSGDWWYRYEGSGALVAAGEKRVQVSPSEFTVT